VTGDAAALWAQLLDPGLRGPGFYYSLPKLGLTAAAYFAWVSTCSWVNEDADDVGLNAGLWNLALLGGGLLGLLLLWLLPAFLLGFLLFLLCHGGAVVGYLYVRDQQVSPSKRLLTEAALKERLGRLFGVKVKRRKADAEEPGETAPIRFIGRSFDQQTEDPARVARAAASKGYRAALQMVQEAIQRRATDIHLEPTRDEMAVRFRIDGILHAVDPFSRAMGDAVVNIFKVLCNMDITEKRKPQDGSFSAEVDGGTVDFRVATAGSVIGEKMVMRVLDRSQQLGDLAGLGMRDKMREQLHGLVTQPHGLFVVCGPTGSGKSTSLYACLNELDRYQQNIITVENPVEYQLQNVTQIEVNPRAGKTFASELRSILRQDPDVIMIGEVRDKETAEIACQAAQTGHMVFTTLHANDAVTAVGRLIDLGVQPFMIAGALTAVLGQRLVRLLCPECKVKYKPNPELLRKLNLPAERIKHFCRPPEPDELEHGRDGEPVKCPHCGGTGYRGRTGIFELLVVSDAMRELMRASPNMNALKQEAVKVGLRPLQEDGMRQVIEGRTSVQELLRVTK
jgi:type II secretory ATPase GspE/PulE/Tfp pilus assembly ATPase PilB-like protein